MFICNHCRSFIVCIYPPISYGPSGTLSRYCRVIALVVYTIFASNLFEDARILPAHRLVCLLISLQPLAISPVDDYRTEPITRCVLDKNGVVSENIAVVLSQKVRVARKRTKCVYSTPSWSCCGSGAGQALPLAGRGGGESTKLDHYYHHRPTTLSLAA